ncbi:MAG: iron-sulfur cluster-binding domain-containing protein, partial [Deltaproteobacteria bacterium]
RRAYSLSTAPCSPGPFAITVKRLSGGRVSGYLHEAVSEGDTLEVLGPSGTFVIEEEDAGVSHHVFVAAGVGITPVISMAESLMMADRKHRVTILYGNRRVEDIVFRERLSRLSRRYRNLRVRHTLTEPSSRWRGGRGRLTGEKVASFLGTISADQRFYLCGPEGMMEEVATFLRERGVSGDQIRIERFVRPRGVGSLPDEARHPIHFLRSGRRVLSRPGVSLLESGLAAGVALPFSCTMGGCGACRTRLRKGSVRMAEPNGLSEGERGEGYILLCVAEARSEVELDA